MLSLPSNLRGIAAMVLATGSFTINDSMMKLAAHELPPYQVVTMRGVAAAVGCLVLLLALGQWRRLGQALSPWVLLRALAEMAGVFCFIVALANLPIADITAIGQTAPLILVMGVSLLWREPIGPLRVVLIGLGFAGALLVAQPGAGGLSLYTVLAFATALLVALRDIVGRRVAADVPAPVVSFATIVVTLVGAGLAATMVETWVAPAPIHLALLAGAGVFVTLGHLLIFLAYRLGATGAVAPFYYCFTLWAVISGALVFGTVPSASAFGGIGLILTSGLAIVFLDMRRAPATAQ